MMKPTLKSTERHWIINHCLKIGMAQIDTLKFLKGMNHYKLQQPSFLIGTYDPCKDVNDGARTGQPPVDGKLDE